MDTQLYTAQELVEDLLIDSGCIANVAVTGTVSGNFSGAGKSFGYFDGNGSNFPFQSGIVMSTGKLSNVPGPNNSLSDDDAPNWTGDADLEQTLGINDTHNATIIEFDFTPNADKIRFRYIFASEEYQENDPNTCVYSDVFAFLIKPVGGQYTNIALVPGTSTPVKVTTVHPEIPGNGGCPAENEVYFESFNGVNSPINFNGQTIPMTAESDVVPGQTYHIKLVIADDQNYRYDSAVFLEAGSFQIGADIGPDLIGNNALCDGETHLLQVAATNNTPIGYKWFKNGTIIPNETTNQLLVSSAGTYKVEVDYGNACIAVDEAMVQYADFSEVTSLYIYHCGSNILYSDGDITVDDYLMENYPHLTVEGYYLDSLAQNPILNPHYFQATEPFQTVYIKIVGPGGCDKIVSLTINHLVKPKIDPASKEQDLCPEKGEETAVLVSGLIGEEDDYEYLWNTGATTPSIMATTPGEYTVKIFNILPLNGTNDFFICYKINTINVLPCQKEVPKIKIDYPKFFTPNNDGFNDYWQITFLEEDALRLKSIHIFNRYGKLLRTMNPFDHGWNGLYNGIPLPSNEYWFVVKINGQADFTGHFSLIR